MIKLESTTNYIQQWTDRWRAFEERCMSSPLALAGWLVVASPEGRYAGHARLTAQPKGCSGWRVRWFIDSEYLFAINKQVNQWWSSFILPPPLASSRVYLSSISSSTSSMCHDGRRPSSTCTIESIGYEHEAARGHTLRGGNYKCGTIIIIYHSISSSCYQSG